MLQPILKMQTLRFFISALLVFCFVSVIAQTEDEPQQKARPKYVVPDDRPGYFRLSVDPTRFLYRYIDGISRGGIEFSADREFKGRYFPVVEGGMEFANLSNNLYDIDVSGLFLRAGIDNNFLRYDNNDDRDMFFMGVRLGYAFFSQSSTDIYVNNLVDDARFNYPGLNYNAFWGEITMGIKTEISKNLFLGWTIRGKQRLSLTRQPVEPYIIPGYGRSDKSFNVSANLYFSYAFPLKLKTPEKTDN